MLEHDLAVIALPGAVDSATDCKDDFLRPDKARQVFERAKAVSLRIVEDGGHLLTWEASALVTNAITEFLGSTG